MSGITSPASAQRGVTVAVVTAASGTGGAVGSLATGSVHVPLAGELPYTGLPLVVVMTVGAIFISAGITLRALAYAATRRTLRRDAQADTP